MQEAHHRIPEPAVGQTLLVPDTGTLMGEREGGDRNQIMLSGRGGEHNQRNHVEDGDDTAGLGVGEGGLVGKGK
jgi:hypothetical protein